MPSVAGQDLQTLSDRLEIEDVLKTYAAAIDDRDWDGVRSQFAPDAVLDYSAFGGPRGSIEDAIPWLQKSLAPISVSQHLVTNCRITLEGDMATLRAYVFSPLALGDGNGVMLVGGSYTDRLQRTGNGWRIVELKAEASWSDRPIRAPR